MLDPWQLLMGSNLGETENGSRYFSFFSEESRGGGVGVAVG